MLKNAFAAFLIILLLSITSFSQNKIKPFNKTLAGVNVSFNCYGKATCTMLSDNVTTSEEKGTLATNLGELSYMFNKKDFQDYKVSINPKNNHFLITYKIPEKGSDCAGDVSISGIISEKGDKIKDLTLVFTEKKNEKNNYGRVRNYVIVVPEVGNFNKYSNEYSDDNYTKKHSIFSEATYKEENFSSLNTTTCEFKSPNNDESNNMVRVILVFGK